MDQDAYVFRNKLVFVMGMQRSGTTALAETLGQDPRLHVEHESPGNAFYDDFFLRPEPELREHLWRIKRRVLLKPISETQRRSVEETLEEFADYGVRVAWIYRDPINVWSSMQVEFQLTEADRRGWAWQWNLGNRSVLDALYGPYRDQIVLVRYEDLIAHRATYTALCRFLDVEERVNLFWRADANKGRRRFDDALQEAIMVECGETLAELHRRRLFVHWAAGRPPQEAPDEIRTEPERFWEIGNNDPPAAALHHAPSARDAQTGQPSADPTGGDVQMHFLWPRRQWQTSVQLLRAPWSVRKGERYSWGFWARAAQPQTVGVGIGQFNWPRQPLAEPTGIELSTEFAWHTGQVIVNRDEEQAHVWLDVRRPTRKEHWWRLPSHLQRAFGGPGQADIELQGFLFVPGDAPANRFELHEQAAGRVHFEPGQPRQLRLIDLHCPRRQAADLKFIMHELEVRGGQTFVVSLRLQAERPRAAALAVGLAQDPWTALQYQPLSLSPAWQTLHLAFTPAEAGRIRVYLELGGDDGAVMLADAEVLPRTLPQMHLSHRPGHSAILKSLAHDPEVVRVESLSATSQDGADVQLCQYLSGCEASSRYALAFRVRADQPRRASFGVHQSVEPWQNLGLLKRLELQSAWQQFYYEFEAQRGDDAPRFHLDLGGNDAAVECSLVQFHRLDPNLSPEELERIRRLLNRVQLGQVQAADR